MFKRKLIKSILIILSLYLPFVSIKYGYGYGYGYGYYGPNYGLYTIYVESISPDGKQSNYSFRKNPGQSIQIVAKPQSGYIGVIRIDGQIIQQGTESNKIVKYRHTVSHDHTIVIYYIADGDIGIEEPNATKPLNDTGITWGGGFDASDDFHSDCSGQTIHAQDCSHGRDATDNDDSDGHAGFSFTKLDANGYDLPASAVQWSCVRDNVTGLVWESKTDDGGIHDKENTYRWGGMTALGDGTDGNYYNDWDSLVNATNQETLCGFNDWRVPSIDELISIVDYSTSSAIDNAFFPNITMDIWSSSPRDASNAWSVYFGSEFTITGIPGYAQYGSREWPRKVLLVSGE